jgi:hypothetical protein
MRNILFIITGLLPLFSIAQTVGIESTNPYRAKFEVHGAVGYTTAIFGGESSGVSIQKGMPAIGFNQYYNTAGRYIGNGYAGVQYLDQTSGSMMFDLFPNGTSNGLTPVPVRVLTLSQAGNIAIGQANYNASLAVARNPGVESTAFFFGTKHHSAFNFGSSQHTYIRAGDDNGTVFINDIPNSKIVLTGPVGINTATPVYPLEIRQSGNRGLALVEGSNFDYWEFRVSETNGNFLLRFNDLPRGQFNASSGAYSSVSDVRLKTNIQPLNSVLSNVLELQPVEYEMSFSNPNHEKTIGFIAQEVKPLFPELVNETREAKFGDTTINDVHGLNYNGFGVVAVKAAQEQQAFIDANEKSIETLQNKLQVLHEKIKQLSKK